MTTTLTERETNVKTLALPEVGNIDYRFNPDLDISDQDWSTFLVQLDGSASDLLFLEMAGKACYFIPERVKALPSLDERLIRLHETLTRFKNKYIERGSIGDSRFFQQYFLAQWFFPPDDRLYIDKDLVYQQIKKDHHEHLIVDPLFSYLLFPDRKDLINDRTIYAARFLLETARNENDLSALVFHASAARIVSYEDEIDILSQHEWRELREDLTVEGWSDFIKKAFHLQILAADRLIFHPTRIEFVRNTPIQLPQPPQVPQTLKF